MRRFVNGDECVLDPSAAEVVRSEDRLVVRSPEGTFSAVAIVIGDEVHVSFKGRQYKVSKKASGRTSHHSVAEGEMRAAMPGQIVDVLQGEGNAVKKGQTVLVLEAMKTHQPFTAPFDGIVRKVAVAKGDQVDEGQLLAVVEAE